ncbi:MAG: hypothetical protein Q9208_006549 [Pyrenodesmia sp. 3 TL-2023]
MPAKGTSSGAGAGAENSSTGPHQRDISMDNARNARVSITGFSPSGLPQAGSSKDASPEAGSTDTTKAGSSGAAKAGCTRAGSPSSSTNAGGREPRDPRSGGSRAGSPKAGSPTADVSQNGGIAVPVLLADTANTATAPVAMVPMAAEAPKTNAGSNTVDAMPANGAADVAGVASQDDLQTTQCPPLPHRRNMYQEIYSPSGPIVRDPYQSSDA